ncbi:MAG: DUF1232 domain-containing protein [Paludibacteraceae bacterium]|nr:DUF1232 domain-containing protein [Paludibacteraceae bacterium]
MENKVKPQDLVKFEKNYSEANLWKKIGSVAKIAGIKTLYMVLLLYYVLMDDATPTKYKAMIMGALGYFILPVDVLPDFVPMVGYSDDLAALSGVLYAVIKSVSPQIKAQAKAKLTDWFGAYNEEEIKDVL